MSEYPWNKENITFIWLTLLYNPFKPREQTKSKKVSRRTPKVVGQSYFVDFKISHDPSSKHNQRKSKRGERQRNWGVWGGTLRPSAGVLEKL